MLARGSKDKKTVKFNNLTSFKTAALLPIVAALLAACGTSSNIKEGSEFGFEADVAEPAPMAAAEPAPAEDDFKVTINPNKVTAFAKAAVKRKVVSIRDGAPTSYQVKKGDTLWDISKKFLAEPWLWPEVWYFNPQIANPHLIYPGDTLVMSYVGNKPQIRVLRPGEKTLSGVNAQVSSFEVPSKVVKLSPRVRTQSIDAAIPMIPINAISSFLSSSRVLTAEELRGLPVIVGSLDKHLISGPDTTVYALNVPDSDDVRYSIVRKGRVFKHHKTKEILGYEALEIGDAKLISKTNAQGVSNLIVKNNVREVLKHDMLAGPDVNTIVANFLPSAPAVEVRGEIIALHNAISNVASNQIVIMDVGSRDGLEVGNVLAIDQTGEAVREKLPNNTRSQKIQFPDVQAGLALVFRVYDRVSYGLIVDSHRSIHMNDKVRNPQISKDF
jgi:hypothetical protein